MPINHESLTELALQASALREEAETASPDRARLLTTWATRLELQASRLERAVPGPLSEQAA
jgi:hypothetical protein